MFDYDPRDEDTRDRDDVVRDRDENWLELGRRPESAELRENHVQGGSRDRDDDWHEERDREERGRGW